MLSYCMKCGKCTESKNPKIVKTKKRKNNAFIKLCRFQLYKSKIYLRARN